jgi:phenylalanyl-tRNA synthetase alpha chain
LAGHQAVVTTAATTPHFPTTPQDLNHSKYVLTPEAEAYLTAGSPEAQLFAAVPPGEGLTLAAAKASLPSEVSDVGFKQAMQQKWVALDKSGAEPRIVRKVGVLTDSKGCGWGR